MIEFLNQNNGTVQAISTVVLALVTIWYAWSTKRMANLMKAQITPRIIIENISMGSVFVEKWFTERSSVDKMSFFSFKTLFHIRNEGNASGSIYKPSLLITIANLSKKLDPITKSYESSEQSTHSGYTIINTDVTYHGSSIFLNGGASEKVELKYRFKIETDQDIDLVQKVKESPVAVQYHLVTKDNYGKEHKYPVTNIQEEGNFGLI